MSFVDPNIGRKNALQNEHLRSAPRLPGGEPIFSHIEFSICGLCNRRCHFCPRVDPAVYPNVKEYMPLSMYQKMLHDLAAVNYTGRLSYSGFSEPFFHKELAEFIASSKRILPQCMVEIVTNGDLLKADNLREVFDAGLNTLLVSMYDGPEQIPHFEALIAEAGVPADRVILRKRYLPPEESYGINVTNRAGMVSVEALGVKALTEAWQHPCYYTHYRMMVDHNGDVLLCPHDWGKRLIAGNLGKQSILDIWTGPILSNTRRRLAAGDRRSPPCNACDVDGTRQGGEHLKAWQAFDQAVQVSTKV